MQRGERELQIVHDAGLPGITQEQASLLRPGSAASENLSRYKRLQTRVVVVSGLLAAYVVLVALVKYAAGVAFLHAIIAKVKEVYQPGADPDEARAFDLLQFVMVCWIVPTVVLSAFSGLIVAVCGFLGARVGSPLLAGCFCACNAVHGGCSCIMLLVSVLACINMPASMAAAQSALAICDPMQCMPQGPNATDREHLVDCLAAGVWEEYQQVYPAGRRMPQGCPPIFLACGDGMPEDQRMVYNPWNEAPIRPQKRRRDSISYKLRGADDEDDSPQFDWPQQRMQGFDQDAMPSQPIEECVPLKTVEFYHLLPGAVSKLGGLVVLLTALLLPMVVLTCLGFWWGRDLWSQLQFGYAQVAYPTQALLQQELSLAPAQPQLLMMQPLIAVPAPAPPFSSPAAVIHYVPAS